jgi:hypothetical protein
MDLRIIEDYVKAIEASHFQDFCDRLLFTLYPEDYTDVRAGGRNGDMKNDGYCYMTRTFFQAHATRGESAKKTKDKISNDFNGCISKWNDVRSFIYITNDTLIGEIENFIDELRIKNPTVTIITWTPKKIISKIKDLDLKDIEYVIERKLTSNSTENALSQIQQEQFKKDCQVAKMYEMEISHFFIKFKYCLHWSLPHGKMIDKKVDEVFNYGVNLTKGIQFNKMSKQFLIDLFMKYDFRNPMINFQGDTSFKPTSFHNLIGILEFFEKQLEKHLTKFGSSISTELSTRLEYMHRMTQSVISNIRLELRTNSTMTSMFANDIADFLISLNDDLNKIKDSYTKYVTGGFPISVGKVTKSDKTNGSIMVETQFGKY